MNTFRQFSNNALNEWTKDVGDENVSTEFINIEHFMLKDLMHSFIYTENINAVVQRNSDLPKFQYSSIKGDNFSSKFSGGCPNCGSSFDFLYLLDITNIIQMNNASEKSPSNYLKCKSCDYNFLELPNFDLSDSIINSKNSKQRFESRLIYVAGIRKSLHFGYSSKWWTKSNVLKNVTKKEKTIKKSSKSNSTIRVLDAMHKKKAPKIQEICPECSHNEAFFTQFQARSADEGTTVMYECCKCQHRRVVNN